MTPPAPVSLAMGHDDVTVPWEVLMDFQCLLVRSRVRKPNKRHREEGGLHAKGTVSVQTNMELCFFLPGIMIY